MKSVRELIALARAKPKALNYATGAPGSTSHLAGAVQSMAGGLQHRAGADKDTGPGLMAVMAGEAHLIFKDAAGVAPQLKAGRVRGLAVTSAKPSPLFPDLPPIAAAGLPGYEALLVDAVAGPARTPAAIIKRLNREIWYARSTSRIRAIRFSITASSRSAAHPKRWAGSCRIRLRSGPK